MKPPLLSLQGLTKIYPGVVANKDITFDIADGEVHALLGENGAGKSTLVKAIYGLVTPNEGQMLWRGVPYAPHAPAEARSTGVAMVFQHFSLFDAMDVAENVALGMDNPPPIRELSARITEVSNNYGLPLDPSRMVGDLSAGERQRVEIIRCLLQDPQLLIMDEPTSVLTPQEVEILFRTLRQLRAEGKSILYISHKLEEIRSLCEHATVLRHGEVVGRCDPREESARSLAEMMVGQSLHTPSRLAAEPGKTLLQVTDLSVASPSAFGTSLKSVNLKVRAGEIYGIGGVAGNGQDELLGALSGELPSAAASIQLDGKPVGTLGPNARRALGLLCAPEERLGHAAAPDMSLTENALLTGAAREGLVKKGFVGWSKARDFAEKVILRFDVRTPGAHVAARALSGGNLQKFVIGREILQRPSVLVVNQPTWGVDASAAAAIRQALLDLAQAGAAVVLVSQDLDEILEIADKFAALNGGKLSAPRPVQGLTMDQIGLMLGGAETGDADVAA
ncbi:ABC transporter ATP-binding protein [Pararhodobacter sp. CCB-MM2]|uniref:ABC transporter ATP-binding protein n=1 Tax=Pararhodobacter sp. CCB-MM2 TaxID=1786003 RepID=UPI00083290E2|nr:ABC transporter ATP-binding protein [Pararhodobacter sp. CCB-MM2]MCA2010894.1 ABC transporter ATP-binding protein [Cereibacter sphaeroides]